MYKQLLTISTHAKTTAGMIKAIEAQTDFFVDFTQSEKVEFVQSNFCEKQQNKLIIFVDCWQIALTASGDLLGASFC